MSIVSMFKRQSEQTSRFNLDFPDGVKLKLYDGAPTPLFFFKQKDFMGINGKEDPTGDVYFYASPSEDETLPGFQDRVTAFRDSGMVKFSPIPYMASLTNKSVKNKVTMVSMLTPRHLADCIISGLVSVHDNADFHVFDHKSRLVERHLGGLVRNSEALFLGGSSLTLHREKYLLASLYLDVMALNKLIH